ncbi:MAG TPA: PilZ domain-containing protein [Allosphingosinicella sp.]|jgi:hypothetical protein|nr:PilZ domain-containing protein [Allosphingosinicella sp.]
MNEFRAAVHKGEVAQLMSPVADKEKCRRDKMETSLSAILIPRVERRTTNQRREDRYRGIVDRATLVFRRKKVLVKVVNISESGMMVEASIMPRIGEQMSVEFEGFEPLRAVVRWIREGRIGLDVGEGAISLG